MWSFMPFITSVSSKCPTFIWMPQGQTLYRTPPPSAVRHKLPYEILVTLINDCARTNIYGGRSMEPRAWSEVSGYWHPGRWKLAESWQSFFIVMWWHGLEERRKSLSALPAAGLDLSGPGSLRRTLKERLCELLLFQPVRCMKDGYSADVKTEKGLGVVVSSPGSKWTLWMIHPVGSDSEHRNLPLCENLKGK